MPAFAWRRRPTRHFGEQWVPFADVRLAGRSGRLDDFSMQVDTGAVISLMRASAAKLLGLDLSAGLEMDLSSVGGASNTVYLHDVRVQLGDELLHPIRIAFSAGETVPHLLGRLDVLDRFRIKLDPVAKLTHFALPPGTA